MHFSRHSLQIYFLVFFAKTSLNFLPVDGFQVLSIDLVEEEKPGGPLDALRWHSEAVERRVVTDHLVGHHKRLHVELSVARLADDDFKKVSRHGHMLLPDDLVPDVELSVGLFLGQVEGAGADVPGGIACHKKLVARTTWNLHIRVHFSQLPDVSFEAIPRVTIEAPSHLRRHVREIECLVDVLLAEFMIASRRQMTAVVA